jgi:DNA polymerase-2
MAEQQGFLLTRHWRDTPHGTEVDLWVATEAGAQLLRLSLQTSVAFIPLAQKEQAALVLRDELAKNDADLRPLALLDFQHRPVFGLYCRQYGLLLKLAKRLREHGINVYESDIRPPERYLMERFIR